MRTRVIILLAVLAVAFGAVTRADRHEETPLRLTFSVFPMQLGEFQGLQRPPLNERVLEVLGLDDYITRAYTRDQKHWVDLYVGYWKSQRQGDTMHSPQNCLPAAGWEPVKQGLLTFPDPRNPAGPSLQVNRYVIQKGLERQLVLYWYQGRGRVVGSEYWSKIYLVLDAAKLNRTDAAIVRVIRKIDGPGEAAEAAAEREIMQFVNGLIPQLSTFLPE